MLLYYCLWLHIYIHTHLHHRCCWNSAWRLYSVDSKAARWGYSSVAGCMCAINLCRWPNTVVPAKYKVTESMTLLAKCTYQEDYIVTFLVSNHSRGLYMMLPWLRLVPCKLHVSCKLVCECHTRYHVSSREILFPR